MRVHAFATRALKELLAREVHVQTNATTTEFALASVAQLVICDDYDLLCKLNALINSVL